MGLARVVLVLGAFPALLQAKNQEATSAAANPIRKVVTMLQSMQKKVAAEGEKEKELYDKFMCYCKTNGGSLTESITGAEAKVPMVTADVKASEKQKVQLEGGIKSAQMDRDSAKAAIAEASALREKEATAHSSEKADYEANIAAIEKAVAALEKGVAGAFLQTGGAQALRRLVLGKQDMLDVDRRELLAFLSGTHGAGYVPASGEIIGILKELGDEMKKGLASAVGVEDSSVKTHGELVAAKTKEVGALSAAIETKTERVGELGVAIVQMKEDLSDTEQALAEDQKFRAELEKGCSTKTEEMQERVQTRSQELTALADTIKILNDDDALELFKKALPSASSSFVQVTETAAAERGRALAAIRAARLADRPHRSQLDLIGLALHGKKVGFEKVVSMIDSMVAVLKKEQDDDDHKKEYCAGQFDSADDKKKGLELTVASESEEISTAEEGIATLKDEIAALEAGIKALDKAVAEATEQRQEEHKEFSELMVSDQAAKELLGFAKNRLNKFYNPKLYKPPPAVELSREDRIVANMGGAAVFAQVSAHVQRRDSIPPPPETFGAYTKKSEETTGVVTMLDMLVKDLDKEMTEAETEEKEAQAEYETTMKDSAEKRMQDSKSLTKKGSAKADLEADLEAHTEGKAAAGKKLMATLEYVQSLHTECDWLMKYFGVRKEARAGEIESLGKAKAVLSGADYALLQTRASGFLSRRSA